MPMWPSRAEAFPGAVHVFIRCHSLLLAPANLPVDGQSGSAMKATETRSQVGTRLALRDSASLEESLAPGGA